MPYLPLNSDDMAPDEVLFLVSPDPAGGFVASATCASIFTQADSWEELQEMAREVVQCHYGNDAHPVIHLRLESTEPDA
jgi:hypothetical protein